ncbi:HutD/Ves family protein [Pseudomonas borbori]
MSIRLVDSHTARRLPWKNGKGVTLELAISPSGASLDDFEWRISSAWVNSAGPFSQFPGIDRSLALLSGAGLRLSLPEPIILDPSNPVLSFAGELDVRAELLAGPVQDFNLMSRRERWRHRLHYLELQGQQWLTGSEVLFVYCQAGSELDCTLLSGEQLRLHAGQGVLLEGYQDYLREDYLRIACNGSARLFLARLERLAPVGL